MTLVRIVKDWDWPDLMRQTPGQKGIWNGIQFTLDHTEECDFLVMLNNRMKISTNVTCPPENIWALMQEPYEEGFSDWMVEKHDFFSRVFTHHIPTNNAKYIPSHPATPWHINRTFDNLTSCQIPEKIKNLSWIVGDAMDLPGHIKRWLFLEFIKKTKLSIDVYGRKIKYIEDKWNALAPYKYSLAIENNSGPYCWTEKLADCFLTWTIPFYFGCTNLEDFFPKNSFVKIDINQPKESLEVINAFITEDRWEKHIPALEEARYLVLHKYQIFPHLCDMISHYTARNNKKRNITIPAYRRSSKAKIQHVKYKLKKKLGILGNTSL